MTFSTYDILTENNIAFSVGATAGYIMAIDADGYVYWRENN